MLSQIYKFKRLVAFLLVTIFCVSNTSMAVFATVITEIHQNGVPFKTDTLINTVGNITNIQTNTTAKNGTIGVNTFGRFNVGQGHIVNLNLINQQNKLVNLIFDSSASQIHGIVNSYKNGNIGGNVLFANPNGFVIGSTGVFNVGSLTLMTPKEDVMKKIFDGNIPKDDNVDKLITFKFSKDNYYVGTTDDGTQKLEMVPAKITIDGKINSAGGIDIINGGRDITIGKDAELNANMSFTSDANGENVIASVGTAPSVTSTFETAMNDGKGITLISQNNSVNKDYLSAIVNIEGKVHANGGNVIAQTEIYAVDKENSGSGLEDVSASLINVKNGADVKGHDVTLKALAKPDSFDKNIIGLSTNVAIATLGLTAIFEYLIDKYVHLGDLSTKVTIDSGAKINADRNATFYAKSDIPISVNFIDKASPTVAFNYTDLDIINEVRVKSGADITAGNNLVVQAVTALNCSSNASSTNIVDLSVLSEIERFNINKIHEAIGKNGSYALSWVDIDAVNRAIIEQGVNLNVTNDINVLASMVRDVSVKTKNGWIPLLEHNRGMIGVAAAVADVDSTNEAIMNADANIDGSLIVNADYVGKLNQSVSGSSVSEGEDGEFGMGGKVVKGIFKFITLGKVFENWGDLIDRGFDKIGGNSKERMVATFGKIHIAGGLNVAMDDAKNYAYVGDSENNIKPVINAKTVVVGSTLEDHKSHITSSAGAKNGETSIAGAVAINIKNLDADAKAYGDFTLSGGSMISDPNKEECALIVRSKTDVERPSGLDPLWAELDVLGIKTYEKTKDKTITDVNSTNVDDYLNKLGVGNKLQEDIDQKFSLLNLLKIFDYINANGGMSGFFQTFAQSTSSAKSKDTDTNAWAGAFAVTTSKINTNAELVGGSVVNLTGANPVKNSVLIDATTNSTMMVGSSLMSLLSLTAIKDGSLIPGGSARDGNATGGAFSVLVHDVNTKSKIGENAVIKTTGSGEAGNVSVLANEDGQFVNIAAGSSAADKSGIAGTVAISVIPESETKASIEQGANVTGKNVTIDATKDDNWYSVIFSFANSSKSVAFGIGSMFFFDTVEAYIKGNVMASGDVLVNAIYDKVFLNVTANIGIAKSSDEDEDGGPNDLIIEDLENDNDSIASSVVHFLDGADDGDSSASSVDLSHIGGDADSIIEQAQGVGNGHVGAIDKNTYAAAGALLLNVANSNVKAYISDNAKVQSGKNVKVNATSKDQNIEAGVIGTFNGKTGGGATVAFNLNKNNVQSYISNATVDAKNTTEVNAKEDSMLYSFSAGIVQAKDKSGVGVLSLDIQKNDVMAAIKDGAKVNTSTDFDVEDQSVKVGAEFDNYLVKGVGSVSISKYYSAAGAAMDTDASKSTINAYIKDSDVNASKEVKVSAKEFTKMIDVTAAGAGSKYDSSYSGSIGLYVAKGELNAYMDNAKINKTEGRTNKGADVKVSAEDKYDNITVTGNVTVGKGTTAGGAMRLDIISDKVNAYIKNSDIDSTGDLSVINNCILDSVAVTASGVVSLEENSFGGAIMLIVNDIDQDSYIENSDIMSKTAKLDSDTEFDSIAVTGGITATVHETAVGGSVYVAVADNDINNYVKNSNITSTNDISLTTDNKIDGVEVVLSGSGGKGVAVSGAVATLVNNSNSNTEIKSENSDKKNIKSTSGKVLAKGVDDVVFTTVTGSVAISVSSASIGGSISTIVDNSNLNAIVKGVDIASKNGVEVDAYADNLVTAITIGGAGGSGVAASGSINTVVMAGDVVSKIVDSVVNTEGSVTVDSYDKTTIKGGTGGASGSISVGALGASIVTGVINNKVISAIENSRVDSTGNVVVSSLANESIGTQSVPFITIAGGGAAGTAIEGVIDTMVINSTSDAHIKGTKTVESVKYGVKSNDEVKVSSEGNVVLYSAGGAASGGGVAGIGATVHTVVIDKDTLSQSSDTIIDAKNITSLAKEQDDFFTTLISAGGGGTAGVAGVVNTNVITSDVKTGIKNSTLTAAEKININSDAKANMQTITGSGSGGGLAGIGLSAVNDVIKYSLEASLDNVTANFDEMSVDAHTDNTYKFSTVSGAGGGGAGVVGVENVNYINNEVKAFATGKLTGNKATVNAKDKVIFKDSYSGVAGGGGTAGVGVAVEVNQITSTVLAYIGGSAVKVKNIDVKAEGEQTFDRIVVAGFAGGGMGGGAGTSLANVLETTVKAYVAEGSNIGEDGNYTNTVSLNATNTTNLTEILGAVAVGLGGAGVGATVGVNKFKNTVEAFTGKNTTVYSKDVIIKAQANNNLGKSGDPLIAVAGAAGLYFGGAGSVMYNSVKDTVNAYVGKNNHVYLSNNGKLDVKATDITKIYDNIGAIAGGAGGLGASVDYNDIENTVVACVKPDSVINGSANVSIVADSQEIVDNMAVIVAGGIGSLTGGVLYISVGKKVGNASYKDLTDPKDRENFESGERQANDVITKANEKTDGANKKYNEQYNKVLDRVVENKDTKGSRVRNIAKKTDSDSLYTKSEYSGATESDTDRAGTTSAFVDSNVKIDANNLTVNAKNSDNIELRTTGVAVGGGAIGVSIAISDDTTTTNAFIQNDAKIEVNSLTLKAESKDDQHIKTLGVAVGIGGGSGSSAHIKSNKTTNAYINKNATIKTVGDMLITAISKSGADKLYAEAIGHAYGGVGVGVSVAHATSKGETKIDIGEGVTLTSTSGNITIKTDADEYAHSDAWAAVGALAGGSGAESYATVGKNTTVNIGKDFSAVVNDRTEQVKDDDGNVISTKVYKQGKIDIISNAKNNAFAESNGRAYGVVSAGGTKTRAKIEHTSGVTIADADSSKDLKAKEINVKSLADNNVKATTYAGAGAAVGIAGSGVYSEISSNNNVYVGRNYSIDTDKYISRASTCNEYLSYNKSNAFGLVTGAIPLVENNITSTVTNKSYASIDSASSIEVAAANEIKKEGVNGYDLYGGSGGLASGSGGYIHDNVKMITETVFGGNRAVALGNYGNGAIDISAYNVANINEKADLYSHAGIAGANLTSEIKLDADAKLTVSNHDIRTKDDNISYAARNDADIYSKTNVESYGGVAGAGGHASAIASKLSASVTFEKDTHSTSGRDTNISAVSNKSLESYVYTRTRGLFSVLNDESNAKSQNSRAYVYINGNGDDNEATGNAVITAFDAINITAQNTASKIRADRDSKAYQLWGIPYTGKGNKNTENTIAGEIVLNGILKSGLGYNKSLHLNIDGNQVDENGNVVENGKYGIYAKKEKIGEIKSSDIQEDITAYKNTQKNIKEAFEDYEKEVKEEIEGYEEVIKDNKIAKKKLEDSNELIEGYISTANKTIEKDNATKMTLDNANIDISTKLESDDSTKFQEFKDAYGSKDTKLDALISAREAYNSADAEHKSEKLTEYNSAKNEWSTHYLAECIRIEEAIRTNTSKIVDWNADIITNNGKIATCNDVIELNNKNITNANADLVGKEAIKDADIEKLQAKIDELEAKYQEGKTINVYAINVDDVIIRSGKITFNGDSAYNTHVSGNGYIHSPGDNASITVINDSISNMVFNKLVINSGLSGGVVANNSTIDSTVHIVRASEQESMIKVFNSVDGNDPTIPLDKESNAGDMVFYGNIENPNGTIQITNYTGSVITQGGITANKLSIRVPNGAYEQKYTANEFKTGGNDATGMIVVGEDLSIASKVIDINSLIKSGTETKQAEIPEFTIKKVGDNYYQVVDGTETLLKESSTTKGYYYLQFFDENNDLTVLKNIKAYFKPADITATGDNIQGDIYLFKANITGGNINLTGNIISTSSNGRIELVNGYGQINVVNNSSYNLVTSSLNSDAEVKGGLTINDFKINTKEQYSAGSGSSSGVGSATNVVVSSVPDYTDFDNIKQSDLTENFLKDHAGTYTAHVDENGNIITTSKNKTEGNGTWANSQNTVINDDHISRTTTYTPGDDAYYVKEGGTWKYYWKYVDRSWIVELFDGKKYEKVWYYDTANPVYDVAKNPITVQFSGFSKPEINITSKGNVIMNNSISCLPGTVNIKSDGNITSNSLAYTISGTNINLTAGSASTNNKIGDYDAEYSTVKPIQVIMPEDGLLNARAKDIYINYPKSDVSNIDIKAHGGTVYLASDNGTLDMKDKTKFGITAHDLELRADVINLNSSDLAVGGDYNITADNWIVRAKDDIYIDNRGDITVKYIVSENGGKVSLISRHGSIIAGATGAYSDYNIHASDVLLTATNGKIGTFENPLKFANTATYNVLAKEDVYLTSNAKMYIDRVTSVEGGVELKAKFGIIASDITTDKNGKAFTYRYEDEVIDGKTITNAIPVYYDGTDVPADKLRVYNISSVKDVYLTTTAGNIENIVIDTDGAISAAAGFNNANLHGSIDTGDIADATSDVNIALLSKPLPTNTSSSIDEYLEGRKNMKIGRVFAAQNTTLSSEGAVLKASNFDGVIIGDDITINAVGNVGDEENNNSLVFASQNLKCNLSIYTKANSNIYLYNVSSLHINRIDVTNNIVKQGADENPTYGSSENSIGKVTIMSIGDVLDGVQNKELKDTTSTVTIKGTDPEDSTSPETADQVPVKTKEVTIDTKSIVNAEQKNPNIRAKSIILDSYYGSIGSYSSDLFIETTSNKGITFKTHSAMGEAKENVYIKGVGDTLYVNNSSTSYDGDVRISSNNTNIVASNIDSKGDILFSSETGNITAANINAGDIDLITEKTLTITTKGNTSLTSADAHQVLIGSKDATVRGGIKTDDFNVEATEHAIIGGATFNYFNPDADKTDYLVSIYSCGDVNLDGATINGNTSITARHDEIYSSSAIQNDINIDSATITGRLYLDADNDINIKTATVTGVGSYLGAGAKGNFNVTQKLNVADYVNITSLKDTTINEVVSGDDIAISAQNADIKKLTSTKDTEINTVNDTKIKDGTVGGKLINKSGTTLTNVDTGEITVSTVGNTEVTGTLNVAGNAEITSTGDVTVTETGKLTADNISINSKNADVANFESKKDTNITTINDTKIGNGTVGGEFTNTSENTTVTGVVSVTGNADIDSTNNVKINEISSDKLNIDSKNADITKLTSVKDTEINTVNNTKIGGGTVGGNFVNKSGTTVTNSETGETTVLTKGNTDITSTLNVKGQGDIASTNNVTVSGRINVDKDANITAQNDIKIADGHIKQNMNLDAKTVKIDEIQIDKLITAHTNTADINTSYDLNINVIDGKDNTHSESVNIVSAQNITNGVGGNAPNILVKDIDLTAGDSIATNDNKLNIDLTKGNSIAVEAGKNINLNTTGAKANYTKLKGKDAEIIADKAVKVRNMNVDNLDLRTASTNTDVKGKINKKGNIRTKDKRIGINNVNLEPDYYATVQLHSGKNEFRVVTNGSNNVKVWTSKFVVRHNPGIVINGTDFLSSMESEAIKAAEVSLKNSDRRNHSIFNTEDYLKNETTQSDNFELIKTIHGDIITPANAFDIINSGNNLSGIFTLKTKKKASVSINDKVSYIK